CGLERLVEQSGEPAQAFFEILSTNVERRDQRIELHTAFVDAVLGALVAVIDDFNSLGELPAMNVKLAGQLAEVCDDLGGDVAEIGDVCFHPPGRGASRRRD